MVEASAGVENLQEFTLSLDKARAKLEEDVWPTFYRLLILTLLKMIVLGSPVRTGRLRGNWQVSIERPTQGVVDTVQPLPARMAPTRAANAPNAGAAIKAGLSEASKLRGFETVYIGNNLPYVLVIEGGSSTQAPEGVAVVALAAIESWLEREFSQLEDIQL